MIEFLIMTSDSIDFWRLATQLNVYDVVLFLFFFGAATLSARMTLDILPE